SLCSLLSFFFSSRRRHTRCYRDWSSDVCSSDLKRIGEPSQHFCASISFITATSSATSAASKITRISPTICANCISGRGLKKPSKIGRASCRERVKDGVDGRVVGEMEG